MLKIDSSLRAIEERIDAGDHAGALELIDAEEETELAALLARLAPVKVE